MAPDLLFHPVFHEAEALAGVSQRASYSSIVGPAKPFRIAPQTSGQSLSTPQR
jgi:hypothetical protein